MGCPKCAGTIRVPLDRERFQCVSNAILDMNFGPPPIPIFGQCNHVYDSAAEAQADATRAFRAEQQMEWNRSASEDRALADDPQTLIRIRDLAAALIDSRPSGSRPVVVEVRIPSRLPGRNPGWGRAEIDRAWPVGDFEWGWKDASSSYPTGITRTGALFILTDKTPSVTLNQKHHWDDPNQGYRIAGSNGWRVRMLRELLAVTEDVPLVEEVASPHDRAPKDRPISNRQAEKACHLHDKKMGLYYKRQNLVQLYGTADDQTRGRPSRAARQAFSEQSRIQAQIDALDLRIRSLRGKR